MGESGAEGRVCVCRKRWEAVDSGKLSWFAVRHLHPGRFRGMLDTKTALSRGDWNMRMRANVPEDVWLYYQERSEGTKGEVCLCTFWSDTAWSPRGPAHAAFARLARGWLNMPPTATQPDSLSSVVNSRIDDGCDSETAVRKSFLISNQDLANRMPSCTRVRRGFPSRTGDFNVPVEKAAVTAQAWGICTSTSSPAAAPVQTLAAPLPF
eukprot:TRINITY_DN3397_c1_g3_i1.p1 TRINITY_DN3397_c1_g3~~TRINITY_DN3397_c1_g3_i1.p1  ORF type:complete len:209 (-),score=8.30 TRINITY_DN3397_c1_g3_i1:97-723(-)